ncbi:MAG: ABC transporter permease [Burkholderiales bacterium]|nr:ABC transporter permease [Burkholderiales bacterium]
MRAQCRIHRLPVLTASLARIRTVAAFAWLEATRTRLPWLAALMALVLLGASFFVRSIAITESVRVQCGFLAAGGRFLAVFVVLVHVLGSMLRENQDKVTELLLSVDMSRFEYLSGKLAGYLVVTTGLCLVFALPLAPFAPTTAVVAWWISLTLECWMVVAAALFCVITFNQLMAAATFVLAFYLLSRAMTAVILIASSGVVAEATWSHTLLVTGVKGVALLLPALDGFTRTAWLVDGATAWPVLPMLAGQAVLYTALLFAAATFDLYRRNQ